MTVGPDMAQEKQSPTPAEIDKQFQRILGSKTFATRRIVRKLLEEVITREQQGEEAPSEYELGIIVCGKSKDWIPEFNNSIRQQALNLRKLLTEYYMAGRARRTL